jgi:nucleoside-diphosphate-sugar epimerase
MHVTSPDAVSNQVVLIVGAAGEIGREVSARLPALLGPSWTVRGADLQADAALSIEPLDITDLDAYTRACAGVDTVVHLAAERDSEAGWHRLHGPNVIGTYHTFEAARRAGCRRVVLASSVHAVAGHGFDEPVGPDTLPHPTGLYGATKVWGEALARVATDRHGLSAICLRIGWAGAPDDSRKLRIPEARDLYLTYGDAARLVAACVSAPDTVRFAVLNAASANRDSNFPIDETRHVVGYEPEDDAHHLWSRLEAESGPRPTRSAVAAWRRRLRARWSRSVQRK